MAEGDYDDVLSREDEEEQRRPRSIVGAVPVPRAAQPAASVTGMAPVAADLPITPQGSGRVHQGRSITGMAPIVRAAQPPRSITGMEPLVPPEPMPATMAPAMPVAKSATPNLQEDVLAGKVAPPQWKEYKPDRVTPGRKILGTLGAAAEALTTRNVPATIGMYKSIAYGPQLEKFNEARQEYRDILGEGEQAQKSAATEAETGLKKSQADQAEAHAEALRHPVPKEGLTPQEQAFHDLTTGENGGPRINPNTQKPYTAMEALREVTLEKPGTTAEERAFNDLIAGDNGKPRINPETKQPFTYLEALQATRPTPQDANKLAGEIEAQVGPRPTTATWNGKNYGSVGAAQAAWGKQAERIKNQEAAAGASARGEAYGAFRPQQVIDTWNGNRPVVVTAKEAEENPSRYAPAGPAEKSLPREALINDIRVSAENVEKNIGVLDSGGFDRATLAASLADPNSTFQSYLQGIPRGQLNDEQQSFVADLFNLREQAMALRTVLGAGQGSEDMRHAILATLPSIASNSSLAKKQLGNLQSVLNRVERGVPTVPLNAERGKTYTDAEVQAAVKAHPGMNAKQIEDAYKAKGYSKEKAQ